MWKVSLAKAPVLNYCYPRNRLRLKQASIAVGILVLNVSVAFASGSFVGSSIPPNKGAYSKGKALFHGKSTVNGFTACYSCHKNDTSLSRQQLSAFDLSRDTLETHCVSSQLSNCTLQPLSEADWDSIYLYLSKRYRLK